MKARLSGMAVPIFILVALALIAMLSVIISERNQTQTLPLSWRTTHSHEPGGMMALHRLLQSQKVSALQWQKPPDKLPDDVKTLVMFNSSVDAYGRSDDDYFHEPRRIQAWVEKGNSLVILGAKGMAFEFVKALGVDEKLAVSPAPAPMPEPFGSLEDPHEPGEPYEAIPEASPLTENARLVKGKESYRLVLKDKAWQPLLKDGKGVLIAARVYGKGRIVFSADADFVSNSMLSQADNAFLLIRLLETQTLAGGRIAIDEYSYGYRDEVSLWQAIGTPGRLIVIQLTLLIIALLYSIGKRFGLAKPVRAQQPNVGDYVVALGETYRVAKASQIAVETLYQNNLRRLAKSLNAPAGTSPEDLIARAPSPIRDPMDHVRKRISDPLNEMEMMALAKAMDNIDWKAIHH